MYTSILLMASLTSGADATHHGNFLNFTRFKCSGPTVNYGDPGAGGANCYGGYGCYGGNGGNGGNGGYGAYGYDGDNGGMGLADSFGCYGCYGWGPMSYYRPSYYPPVAAAYAPPMGFAQNESWGTPGHNVGEIVTVKNDRPAPGNAPAPNAVVKTELNAKALVLVHLPADASLYLNGKLTRVTDSPVRPILTPNLQSDSTYFYELRAEVIRDGNTLSQTRRVSFQSGQQIQVTFDNLGNQSPNLMTVQTK